MGLVVMQCLQQFIAESEYFLCHPQNSPPGFGQFEIAPRSAEQVDTESCLEFAELPADRLRREMQLPEGHGQCFRSWQPSRSSEDA